MGKKINLKKKVKLISFDPTNVLATWQFKNLKQATRQAKLYNSLSVKEDDKHKAPGLHVWLSVL